MSRRASSPPSRPRPRSAIWRPVSALPVARPIHSRWSGSRYSPKPTTRRRASGCLRSTSGQAASRRSTPLETMSLPTNNARGPSPSANHSTASAAVRGSRPHALAVASAESRLRRSARSRRRSLASAVSRAGVNRSTSTPGGPNRVFCSSPGRSRAAHRLSPVCLEPTSTPEAACIPSRANGRKRSGSGFTVYSSAEPCTLAAKPGPPAASPSPARARIAGPITRWFARAAPGGPAVSTTPRTAATLASR